MTEGEPASETSPPSHVGEVMEVSAGLVFRHGLLLITQRRPGDHLGGMWEFPGGKRQAGESDEDCLERELAEELGIEVEILGLLETVTHAYPERAVRLKFFQCVWRRHEPRSIECHDFIWVAAGQLADYSFPAADAKILKKLLATPVLWA